MTNHTYSFEHEAMASPFEVIVAGQEREYARQAAGAAFDEIDRMERLLSDYDASDGLFDPTVGTGFQWLEIDRETFFVGWKSEVKGRLDLGGIGKGYAIDKAAEVLADWAIHSKAVRSDALSTAFMMMDEQKIELLRPDFSGRMHITPKPNRRGS